MITAGLFAALWLAMWGSLEYGYWITLLLALPAAGFLVRLFVIQHDCGHGSLFRSRRANDWVGRLLGVVTLTPYGYWRNAHAIHHATSGNLDRRGVGDVNTLTVDEYRALPPWRRAVYRLYRHPLTLFAIGPAYVFVFKHRLPFDLPLLQKRLWFSVLATNIAIVGLLAALAMGVGLVDLLKIQVPVVLLTSSMGVWLFFVHHQFEDAYWQRQDGWDFHWAAIKGTSYYNLPRPLHWLTCHIGLHHVHHLCSKVPNYRLRECLEQIPELRQARHLGLLESLKCARLALWDERAGKMIRFRDLARCPAGLTHPVHS